MNVEDMVLIEKIERLAFQAGAAGKSQQEPVKDKPEHPFIAKLKVFAAAHSGYVGTALYHTSGNVADNIEWKDLIAWAQEK